MDSNSTFAPNQQAVHGKGTYRLKRDQFAIAIYDDNHPASVHSIASPAVPKLRLGIDSRIEVLLEGGKERPPKSFSPQEGDLFHDSLVISGAKLKPLNPWAAVGSGALLSLVLLSLVLIPLFHADVLLPERRTLTMLYAPPAATSSSVANPPTPTSSFRNTPTTIRIPSAVHTPQEAPSAPVVAAGGVVGGVPGGVVGGIPGGVLSGVLHYGTAPVLASTPAASPKRVRVPAAMAEANLVYDVAPKYPPEAGRSRIEGTVVLMALIGKDGTVQDVRVQSGLSVLAQAAIEAVKQWRYRPYLLNGEPVEVDSQITINFNLSRG
jgi:periplasmic protein TonB